MGSDVKLSAESALVVYGTLAPGEVNHHAVATIGGTWVPGVVRGYLFEIGWGPAEGYDGFYPDPEGHRVDVMILVSDRLEQNWRRLDDFEGPGYRRRVVDVFGVDDVASVAGGASETRIGEAQIYEALTDVD